MPLAARLGRAETVRVNLGAHGVRAAAVALLAMLLAGCEVVPGPRDAAPTAEPPAEEPPASEPVVAPVAPVEAPEAPKEQGPPPPAPQPKPEIPRVVPEELTGLTSEQAELLLGPPDERSEEPPAVVWTYVTGPCRLELFFYFDLESQQQRSLTFDLVPGHEGHGAESFCFALLARRGAQARRLESVEEQLPHVESGLMRRTQEGETSE